MTLHIFLFGDGHHVIQLPPHLPTQEEPDQHFLDMIGMTKEEYMRKDLELKAQAEAEDSALITIEEVEEEPEEQKGGLLQRQQKRAYEHLHVFFFGQARIKMGRTLAFFPPFQHFFKSIGLFTSLTDYSKYFWCPLSQTSTQKTNTIQVHHYSFKDQKLTILQQKKHPTNNEPTPFYPPNLLVKFFSPKSHQEPHQK